MQYRAMTLNRIYAYVDFFTLIQKAAFLVGIDLDINAKQIQATTINVSRIVRNRLNHILGDPGAVSRGETK